MISQIAEETPVKEKAGKIDIDANCDNADRFSIQAIPIIMIFKDGLAVVSLIGRQSKSTIQKALSKHVDLK